MDSLDDENHKPSDTSTGPSSRHGRPHPPEQSAAKRGRPCDACRRGKSKCVTEDNNTICVLCKLRNHACTYLQAPQPRKRNVNPAVGAITESPVPAKRKKALNLRPGTGVEEYDTLPGSLLKRTLGLQNRHHSEYIGLNAIPDVYGVQTFDTLTAAPGGGARPDEVRFVHSSHAFRIVSDEETEGYDQERNDIDEIQALACGHGAELVHLYFRVVHPSFPVLHQDVYIEKYERSFREFSPPLLAAVYLLASSYWAYDEKLSKHDMIDTAALQALAFSALQCTMRRPKLSTIQAGLLLSQWQKAFMGASNENRDRLTVQLVNIGHGLGLHLDCSHWELPEWEIGLRRRIGWALYCQDKWTALLESRPSLISPDDWEVEHLTETDFPESIEDEKEGSGEVERGRLVFTHMAHLSVILAEILRTIFSARARKLLDGAADRLVTLLEWMKPLQVSLKEWFLTLPESLKMDTAASMKLSSVGYLRLAYLTVEVCLHKKLLRTLCNTSMPIATIAQVCRAAANERFINGTDFVQRLQAQHLQSFWYHPSARCLALIYTLGQTLSQTSSSEEERSTYNRRLKEYKWSLKVNSEAGASFMKQALALINQSFTVINQAGGTSSTTTSPASAGFHFVSQDMMTVERPQQIPEQQQQQQQQWIHQHHSHQTHHPHPPQAVENGDMPYNGYHDYELANAAFADPENMFLPIYDNTWTHDLR